MLVASAHLKEEHVFLSWTRSRLCVDVVHRPIRMKSGSLDIPRTISRNERLSIQEREPTSLRRRLAPGHRP
jgi:hypothetical protein